MDQGTVLEIIRSALSTALFVAGPLLFLALLVGLLVSVFQALTQINEATLTFIPKILAVGGGLLIMGPWLLRVITTFTTQLYDSMSLYVR